MNPRVKKVEVVDDYKLIITFINNQIKIFDVKPYLNDKFWSRLSNYEIFKNVKVSGGSITWLDEEIDFCPDEVYEKSVDIAKGVLQFTSQHHSVASGASSTTFRKDPRGS